MGLVPVFPGEASRWSKHLELLPSAYHSLPCLADDEMQLLEGCVCTVARVCAQCVL